LDLLSTSLPSTRVVPASISSLARCQAELPVPVLSSLLSAASFAATQGIAGLVNEINFSSVYQQGESYSILVLNVDEYSLLTVIFKARISAGAVKYFAETTMKEIAAQLKRAQERDPDTGLDLSMLNMADPAPMFTKKKKKVA